MKDVNLFKASHGDWVTSSTILTLLEKVKASDARVLYMHTGMTFGAPNPRLGRRGLLECLHEIIASLSVPTLCVPTFTFSFCNGERFDVSSSPCRMGALNEYLRKLPGAVRSVDPLLSSAAIGEDHDLVTNLGKHSIGYRSTFDKLHSRGADVRFLFFGARLRECFTYTHYVEERLGAPYRYDREFTGTITDGDNTWEDTYTLFVRYRGVAPATDGLLATTLRSRELLLEEPCGDSSISCLAEPDGYKTIVELYQENEHVFIAEDPEDRNTTFVAHNMVAL